MPFTPVKTNTREATFNLILLFCLFCTQSCCYMIDEIKNRFWGGREHKRKKTSRIIVDLQSDDVRIEILLF